MTLNKFHLMVILTIFTLLTIPAVLYLALSDKMLIHRNDKPGKEPFYSLVSKPISSDYTLTADSKLEVWPKADGEWKMSVKYAAEVSVPEQQGGNIEVALTGLQVSSGLCDFDMLPSDDAEEDASKKDKAPLMPTLVPDEFMKVFGSNFDIVANAELLKYFGQAKKQKFVAKTDTQGQIVSVKQLDRPDDAPAFTKALRETFQPSANVLNPIWRAMLPDHEVGDGAVWRQEINDPTEVLGIDTYEIECILISIDEGDNGKIASILFASKIFEYEHLDEQTKILLRNKNILFNGRLTWNIDLGRPEKLTISRKFDVILSNKIGIQEKLEQRVGAIAVANIDWDYKD
jgi:hypothetical protein